MGYGCYRRVAIRRLVLSLPARASCPGVAGTELPFSIHAGLGHRLRLSAIGEIILRPLPRHRHPRPDIAAAAVGRTPPIRTDQLGWALAAQLDPRAGRGHKRPFYHGSRKLAHRVFVDGRIDAGASLRLGVGGAGAKGPGPQLSNPAERARRNAASGLGALSPSLDHRRDDVLPVGYLDRHGDFPADALAGRTGSVAHPGWPLTGFPLLRPHSQRTLWRVPGT